MVAIKNPLSTIWLRSLNVATTYFTTYYYSSFKKIVSKLNENKKKTLKNVAFATVSSCCCWCCCCCCYFPKNVAILSFLLLFVLFICGCYLSNVTPAYNGIFTLCFMRSSTAFVGIGIGAIQQPKSTLKSTLNTVYSNKHTILLLFKQMIWHTHTNRHIYVCKYQIKNLFSHTKYLVSQQNTMS